MYSATNILSATAQKIHPTMSAFAEEEEEYEEISAEEKLRIATHFLLSAPSGEIQELLGDVRKVVGADVLSEAALGNVFRTYNIENHTLAEVEAGKFMLVSKHGEVDGTHYVDPRAGKVYGFNHMTQVRRICSSFTTDAQKQRGKNEDCGYGEACSGRQCVWRGGGRGCLGATGQCLSLMLLPLPLH